MRRNFLMGCFILLSAWGVGCGGSGGTGGLGLSQQQVMQACVRATACGVFAYGRVQECLTSYQLGAFVSAQGPMQKQIYECVNAAGGDCTAVAACFGRDSGHAKCDKTFKARCDGSKAVTCNLIDDHVYTFDCGAANLPCTVSKTNPYFAACGKAPCTNGSADRCENGRLVRCVSGETEIQDCAAAGLVCDPNDAAPMCKGASGLACGTGKEPFEKRCEGNVAHFCAGRAIAQYDCSQGITLQRCQSGQCVAAGNACKDQVDSCVGNDLKACVDGIFKTISCSELGLGPCETQKYGARCSGGL